MLRRLLFSLSVAVVSAGLVLASGASTSHAQGWPYDGIGKASFLSIGKAFGQLKRYVQDAIGDGFTPVRFSGKGLTGDDAVLVMKLGMGIPYCKNHAATIAVRDGKYFRTVGTARTMRGVTASTIGLTAARLRPGTYFIVHGFCNVGGRRYNVGSRLGKGKAAGRLYRTAYATFTINNGQVLNAGFLRFFPPRRRSGRLRIKLQGVPRADLQFLARRYPRLRRRLTSRLMSRTNAAGQVPGARPVVRSPARKPVVRVPAAKTIPKKRRERLQAIVPKVVPATPPKVIGRPSIALPNETIGKKTNPQSGPITGGGTVQEKVNPATPVIGVPAAQAKTTRKTSITFSQRRAACTALSQLMREGKVKTLPANCEQFGAKGSNRSNGLPPAAGPDK